MPPILSVNWHDVFIPTIGLLELVFRASLVYLGIFFAMRLFRREAGSLSTADLLVVVVIADAAQNGMSSRYDSVTEAAVLVATIIGWNLVLDWAGYRFPAVYKLLNAPPLPLVQNGRIHRQNLRKQFLTRDDLMEQLREKGVEDVGQVKSCHLEGDGHLSVILHEPADAKSTAKTKP